MRKKVSIEEERVEGKKDGKVDKKKRIKDWKRKETKYYQMIT